MWFRADVEGREAIRHHGGRLRHGPLRVWRYARAGAGRRAELLTGIAYLLAVLAFPVAQHGTVDPCTAVAERSILTPLRDEGGAGALAAGALGQWIVPELARARLGSAGCFRVLWADALDAGRPPPAR